MIIVKGSKLRNVLLDRQRQGVCQVQDILVDGRQLLKDALFLRKISLEVFNLS